MVDVALAAIAGLGLIQSTAAAERQASASRQGRRVQEESQRKAEAATVQQARTAEEAENRARQKSPDLTVLLDEERNRRAGPSTIDVDRLLLGRPGALGY